MTELAFLLELLLEHKLTPATKAALATRIKLVESQMNYAAPAVVRHHPRPAQAQISASPEAQALAASLSAAANSEPGLPTSGLVIGERVRQHEPIPAQAVGITSAAAEAMATRNKLIAEAQAGIAKKGPAVGRGHGTK